MGELRDRMVRDMDLRNFSARTVESYVDQVKGLAKYYRRPPDQLSNDEIQRYLLYVREERRLSSSTYNQLRAALKFFYEVTLQRPHAALAIPPMRSVQKLPESRAPRGRMVCAASTWPTRSKRCASSPRRSWSIGKPATAARTTSLARTRWAWSAWRTTSTARC